MRSSAVLLVPAAAFMLACASRSPVPPAAVKTVVGRELLLASGGSRPIEFGKLVVKTPREGTIGTVQTGRSCSGRGPLSWKTVPNAPVGSVLGEILLEELSAAGYTVAGDPDALFEDPHADKPEFVVAGIVREIRANVCYGRGGPGTAGRATGEASLAVDWQIYSYRSKTVEFSTTTEGASRLTQPRKGAAVELIFEAFLSASRSLLAEKGFHELVVLGAPLSRHPVESTPIEVAYRVPAVKGEESVESLVADARMGVVTVLVGSAMGSGFVISTDGYVLTSQHVVGNARYVKVRFLTGREVNGEVVRSERLRDVALVKLESDIYQPLALGSSSTVQPGSEVFAIGTPLSESFSQTVTKGIISGYGEEDGLRILRSDVSVHRGNSGGPLLARTGGVVGMTVSGFMLMPEGIGVGLNSFIPIEEALTTLGIRRLVQR